LPLKQEPKIICFAKSPAFFRGALFFAFVGPVRLIRLIAQFLDSTPKRVDVAFRAASTLEPAN
jgi:hypothetical protein